MLNEGLAHRAANPEGMHQAEAALLGAARQGDLAAFNRLVLLYQDSLYGWVNSLVKDEALADDITQAVFLKAYEKLDHFRGGSFRAWLFTIARNRSFDELRKHRRHPTVSLDGSPEDERERLAALPDGAPLPEEALLASEQAEIVLQMLNRLPDAFQQVLRLVDMEGLEYLEAAAILGLTLGTLKSRLTRARLKMRDLLSTWESERRTLAL